MVPKVLMVRCTLSTLSTSERSNRPVRLRSAIPIELPRVADFLDEIQIQIRDHELVLVAAALGDQAAARIAEVALAVELADVPGRLGADAVDRPHEIAVRDRVCGLLELPEILREARDRRRRVEPVLGPVQPEGASPL